MSKKIIIDPGSTHGGDFGRAKRIIDFCKSLDVYAVKFQLFRGDEYKDNIELSEDLFLKIVEYSKKIGVKVFASVFCYDTLGILHMSGIDTVKISYNTTLKLGAEEVNKMCGLVSESYVSCDVFNLDKISSETTALYCHGINGNAVYPVVERLNLEAIKARGFNGFSSHFLDWRQTAEAAMIFDTTEFHMKLDDEIGCPDEAFAHTQKESAYIAIRSKEPK